MTDEYELLPHQLLEELKSEVELLKKKLMEPDAKAQELILEMETLKDSVHDLQEIFQKALDISKGEDISGTITALKEKIEAVVKQNETIARALLTISDKFDQQAKLSAQALPPSSSAPSFSMGPPPLPGSRIAPRPEMPLFNDLPPPPPRKKGLFP